MPALSWWATLPESGGAATALQLPDAPLAPRRAPLPLIASVVPVLGAVALWLVTGTVMMLWFAALGPLIAAASMADAARTARHERRRRARDDAAAHRKLDAQIQRRHDVERTSLWLQHPDVAGLLTRGPSGADQVWRRVPGRDDVLVVGSGWMPSALRTQGGGQDAQSEAMRRRAAAVENAPVTVPMGEGIAVVGTPALAAAIVRALAAQVLLMLPPDVLRIDPGTVGMSAGMRQGLDAGQTQSDRVGMDWLARMPHAGTVSTAATSTVRVRTLAVAGPGEPPAPDADIVIAQVDVGTAAPPQCGAVLTIIDVDRARLVRAGRTQDVGVEGVSALQMRQLADLLTARAQLSIPGAAPTRPVGLSELLGASAREGQEAAHGLTAVFGVERGVSPFGIDLVEDGPHALVAGVTGSGKSELLTSWIVALCARYRADEVSFLLADFKGGTAFDALRGLPHVTGVLTDLDAGGAERALRSLRAELRHREARLTAAATVDLATAGLGRLVIVVDEFAALAAAHPELQDVFIDVAARGRALGMHLILGTQRAAGTFRDALLANCPLRISLRVTDAADSRALIGVDDAARLSGAPGERGVALVRRAADSAPRQVRIARADTALIDRVAEAALGDDAQGSSVHGNAAHGNSAHRNTAHRVWLPPLPTTLELAGLDRADAAPGDICLGLADEPDHQRQSTVLLRASDRGLCVLGSAGSGRTGALSVIAAQSSDYLWVPSQPERAWDALSRLNEDPSAGGQTVLIDDVDALLARLPAEYAHVAADRIEQLIHAAPAAGVRVVLSAQRLTGAVTRLADLLPRRAVLAFPTRADHVAAGGSAACYVPAAPSGRAELDGHTVQFALAAIPGDRDDPRYSADPDYPRSVAGARSNAARSHAADTVWSVPEATVGVVARPGLVRRRVIALARHAGVPVVEAGEPQAAASLGPDQAEVPALVICGDGDQWQRAWSLLQQVRNAHTLLVDAACAPEYRALTGDRELPPYCLPGRGRAWMIEAGRAPRRVTVPGPDPAR